MLLSLFYISLEFFRSMILKAIWSQTPFQMIYYIILITIRSSLTSFAQKAEFLCCGRGSIETQSNMSFLISIDLVIPDHISQLAKLVRFSCLLWVLPLCDSLTMTCILSWNLWIWFLRVFFEVVVISGMEKNIIR